MKIKVLMGLIEKGELSLLEEAITNGENLNVCDPETGQSFANWLIALNCEAAINLLLNYLPFDWGMADEPKRLSSEYCAIAPADQRTEGLAPSGVSRLWAQQFLLPEHHSSVYHVPVGLQLQGKYDAHAIRLSLQSLINQHDVLRSRFVQSDEGLKIQAALSISLPWEDVTIDKEDVSFKAYCQAHFEKVFDFNQGPMWRVALIRHAEKDAYLFFVYHHIIIDGNSLDILMRDFAKFYNYALRENAPAISSLQSNRYLHYASQQTAIKAEDRLYWEAQLKDYPDVSLPILDKTRPAMPTYKGRVYRFSIDLPDNIKGICQHYNNSLTTIMYAMYHLLLYKITGQQDLIIGTPVSFRGQGAYEDVVGYFIDTLPIRLHIEPGQTLVKFIEAVSTNRSMAYAHQALDFSTILKILNVKNNPAITPLFQCFFIMMEQESLQSFKLEGLEAFSLQDARGLSFDVLNDTTARYDLTLRIDQQDQQLFCRFEYATDCFQEGSIAALAEYFQHLVKQVMDITSPSKCYEQLVLAESSPVVNPIIAFQSKPCLFSLLKRHAQYRPTQVALSDASGQTTYQQLWLQVNALAMLLKKQVQQEHPIIAIMMPRGRKLVISQLAILAVGGAYVPIDPDYPPARKQSILTQANAHCIICDKSSDTGTVPALNWEKMELNSISVVQTGPVRTRNTPAYILFTSGSTGQPKGIAVSYGALMDFLESCQAVLPLGETDLWLSITHPGFDISGYEYFGSLYAGASCYIIDQIYTQNGELLKNQIERIKPTMLQATPITWENLASAGWIMPAGFRAICGGERLSEMAYRFLTESAGHAYQFYGPTEATIWATYTEVRLGRAANNIGRPLFHMQAYVLDSEQRILPPWVPGELYLAGSGLAEGYWKDEEKTNQAFLRVEALPSVRLYRTGDKARMLPDGSIEYIGRIDTQLKVNGYRIESGEIEAVLSSYPGVQNCVIIRIEGEGVATLVACIQTRSEQTLDQETLFAYSKQRLPSYMVPSSIYFITHLPLNSRGKVDRKRLQEDYLQQTLLHVDAPIVSSSYNENLSWFVRYLTPFAANKDIYSDLAKTNFFDLGLTSRHVIEMAHAFTKAQGVKLQPALCYQYPNPTLIVRHLANQMASSPFACRSSAYVQEREPIAIIGMACRYPNAQDVSSFWDLLINMRSGLHRYSEKELRELTIPDTIIKQQRYVPVAGRILNIDRFDAIFFNFNPKEASLTSPSQRVFLETVWHALEDANSADGNLKNEKIAIFAGCGDNDYLTGGYQNLESYSAMLGTEKDYLATRVAYKLNFTGPAVNIQTACSSSLVGIHYAVNSLQASECTMAVAGGVSIVPAVEGGYVANDGFMFSLTGRCAPFSKYADGIVASHGAGVVVLKPLSKAQLDGDQIYGVIRGTAVNNDGSDKASYVAPSPEMQAEVIEMALKRAGISKEAISYIEAHGTGTALGDPIEINGLTKVYTMCQKQSIAIGSVKGNIGHTIAASGVAGVIKVALALRHRQLPGTLNAEPVSDDIDFTHSPFRVLTRTELWQTESPIRSAGVSSFGIGGTNAHAILEEAPKTLLSDEQRLKHQWEGVTDSQVPHRKSQDVGPWVYVISAKTATALKTQVKQLLDFLNTSETIHMADLSYTLSVGRAQMKHRLAVEAKDASSLKEALNAYNASLTSYSLRLTILNDEQLRLCREWYHQDAAYGSLIDGTAALVASAGVGLLSSLMELSYFSAEQRHVLSFVYQYNALRRYQGCGLKLDSCESGLLGTLISAVITGKLSLEDALRRSIPTEEDTTPLSLKNRIQVGEGVKAFRKVICISFLQGEAINWCCYWRGSIRQKISVPLYPFERERFWHAPGLSNREGVIERTGGLLGAGPIFLGEGEWLYQQELSLSSASLSYLLGHRIFSSCVFPGSGYTEMLLSAARRVDANAAISIKELHYKEPLKLVEGVNRICQVRLLKKSEDIYEASILSFVAGIERPEMITHAQGGLSINRSAERQSQPHVDIKRMSKRYNRQRDVSAIYSSLANDGVHYAEVFRGVKSFSYNDKDNISLAQVSLERNIETAGYSIHPILLDSAFQSLAGTLLLNREVPAGMTYIPVGHGGVKFYREMGASGYAQGGGHEASGEKELKGDIAIYTEEGNLALMVHDLKLAAVPKAMLEQRLGVSQETVIRYQLNFIPNAVPKEVPGGGTWLLVGDEGPLSGALRRELSAKGGQVLLETDDLKELRGSLGVIYLGSLREESLWELMKRVQRFKQARISVKRFLVVTEQALRVQETDEVEGYHQGVYRGFCTSLSAACPDWQVSLLDIDDCNRADAGHLIALEARQEDNTEMILSYRGENRFVARMRRDGSLIRPAIPERLFNSTESCLITGGLGGLGLRVTDWLVSRGAQHVVLLNRKGLATEPSIIQTWREKQVNVELKTANVSDMSSLRQIFSAIKEQQRQIVGVFHLAGVLRDALIENLSEQDFTEVLAPKVQGGENLHQLTKEDRAIRYFVLFSSLVSCIGSPGQLNYAAANGYLDALSERRTALRLPSQRLNFGAWAEVGMAANLTEEQRYHGMEQISIEEGLQSMGETMVAKPTHLVVARVDWERIWRRRRQQGFVQGLVNRHERLDTLNQDTTWWGELVSANLVLRKKMLQDYIINKLIEVTQRSVDFYTGHLEKGFTDLHLGSLEIKSIGQDLIEAFSPHVSLEGELLYDHPTIERLVAHLNEKVSAILQSRLPEKGNSSFIKEWVKETLTRDNLSLAAQAVIKNNIDGVRLFGKNRRLTTDIPLVILAAMNSSEDIMKMLVEFGCDINVSLSCHPFITPITVAVATGHIAVVTYLLEKQCTIPDTVFALETSDHIKQKLESYQQVRRHAHQ